jgi:hypothetical protein
MSTSAGDAADPAAGPFRCSTASASRAEAMFATASRVDRWLLVEQPGPWGPESVPAGRMAPEAHANVSHLAREFGARLLLMRRPAAAATTTSLPGDAADGGPSGSAGITVFFAESRPGREWLMSRRVQDESELAALGPPSRDPGWTEEADPIYLVCTHGRHDPCCALFGRPVAAALCAREPERTWECSHVGGDRFGANVVVLPAGLYLGRVIPGRVDPLVELIREGRIPLDQLRGRSSLPLVVQAAQHFARAEEPVRSWDRVDDLQFVSERRVGDATWEVVLRGRTGRLAITVRRELSDVPQQLTCHVAEPKYFPGFQLVGIELPAAS